MRLAIGYPDRAAQRAILNQRPQTSQPKAGQLSVEALRELQSRVEACRVAPELQDYMIEIAELSRQDESVALGVSPRGMLIWQQVSKAWAILNGRDFVIPDDVQAVARPVLGVRLVTRGQSTEVVMERLIQAVPVPSYRQVSRC